MRPIAGPALFVCLLAHASTASTAPWQGHEETRDGVLHVLSPAAPMEAYRGAERPLTNRAGTYFAILHYGTYGLFLERDVDTGDWALEEDIPAIVFDILRALVRVAATNAMLEVYERTLPIEASLGGSQYTNAQMIQRNRIHVLSQ